MGFARLISPIRIGTIEVANRFVVAPMITNYANSDNTVSDRLIAYWEARARGGWGLLISETTAVDPLGRGYATQLGVWDDRFITGLARLPEVAHKYGTKIVLQIDHAGRQTTTARAGGQPVAPSPIPCPRMKEMPRELTTDETWAIIEKFGDGAARARQAGFDAVEVHGCHGFLVAEFLSAYANSRTDIFGGSYTNRLRFSTEIINNIKRKAGDDYPVIFRFSAEEKVAGGLTLEDSKQIAPDAQEAGADALSLSQGVYESLANAVAPATTPAGYQLPMAAEIRKWVSVPVIAVGRITDPVMAEHALETGMADLIAWGRQSLADPETPNKVMAGQLDEIIQCDACMKECIGKAAAGQAIGCAFNPACGWESDVKA